jgi:hypothetical protein
MRIPRFWAVVEGSDTGRGVFRRVWGWSMTSTAEALTVARERLRSALAGPGPGGYYPRVPLREPILDELIVEGEQLVVVTRNRYGAEVLNTDRVVIADIDLPEPAPPGGLLGRIFGRPDPAPSLEDHVGTVADWARAHPDFGVLVYRTASGLRVFVTGVAEPTSPQGERILAELGADPVYRELCRNHGTYRARLTPKPWRLPRGKRPRDRWPFPDTEAEWRFRRWLADYAAAAEGFGVCRLVVTHGPAPSTVESLVIRLHDERTRVEAELPLA